MSTRAYVGLFLGGVWLMFFAFLFLLFNSITVVGFFSVPILLTMAGCFILNWLFFIPAYQAILKRARQMQQAEWLETFKTTRIPFILGCVTTWYAITWPESEN